MKRVVALLSVSLFAVAAWADKGGVPATPPDAANNGEAHRHHFPLNPNGDAAITPMPDEGWQDLGGNAVAPSGPGRVTGQSLRLNPIPLATNITYHGGDVINTA